MGNHALIVYDNLPKRGEKMEIDKKLLFFDKIFVFFLGGFKISIYLCTEINYRLTIKTY